MLFVGNGWPGQYEAILQEDRSVEWGTVWLFGVAGVLGLRGAVAGRRWFDVLVALFCFFVAGEEFSWGQRLIGYYPAELFLANNFQQEANLHNLPQWFLQPKWFLMMVLAGYGLVLPAAARSTRVRELMARAGATPPPTALIPWFIAAIALLLIYPLTFTGEWVELFAGMLFLMSTRASTTTRWTALALAAVFGGAMTVIGGTLESGRDVARRDCATTEVTSLADDLAMREAGTARLWRPSRVHKRIWSSGHEGYLQVESLNRLKATVCGGAAGESGDIRHKYGIDPWGSPYWLLVERDEGGHGVMVYSFGPNRRRDVSTSDINRTDIGDDVVATQARPPVP